MPHPRPLATLAAALALLAALPAGSGADEVQLKNKMLLRGTVDRDNTLRQVSDGLKRVVIRDSKIERITPSDPFRGLERFAISQPLTVHGGLMPKAVYGVQATPWDEKGRRKFSYINGERPKAPVVMNQAINDLGPHMVGFRGIDGFWKAHASTRQVPRPVVLGLLERVDKTLLNEQQRVLRFLIQSEWYPEAKAQAESIAKAFPDEKDRINDLIRTIGDLDARQKLAEIDVVRKAGRPADLLGRLRVFPAENVAPEVLADARDLLRKAEADLAADRRLGDSIREVERGLPAPVAKDWSRRIAEVLRDLEAAPDAVRGRLAGFLKAETSAGPESRLALAMSGWIVGADAASASLDDAAALWKARGLVRDYLRAKDDATRSERLAGLQAVELSKDTARPDGRLGPDGLTRLVQLMPPPLDDRDEGKEPRDRPNPLTHRVGADENDSPTDYMVLLPPEYHPLRSYPAVVALHDGRGSQSAINAWGREATRRGYIVVAPDWRIRGKPAGYQYSETEAASVELSVRDARKRYSIDSDRVYCAGNLLGANMVLDFGLAHPDLFAAAASIAGEPAKFAYTYRKHVEFVPLYLAVGDLTPGTREVTFDVFAKPLILDAQDVIYVEYFGRGLEDLPEEVPSALDFLEKHSREPYPRSFDVNSARKSDDRFFGVVVKELAQGREIAPLAAEVLGGNIHPARITLRNISTTNLLNIRAVGVTNLDVWVGRGQVDFKRKMEVRINDRVFFKGVAKPDASLMLTDLRFRGDRQQLYWFKVSTAR